MAVIDSKRKLLVAKPFVKWAGGKGSLVKLLASHLPPNFCDKKNVTYIEPFVGGGAMLFYMLTHFQNICRVIINDVNADLIGCYRLIKESPEVLIEHLKVIENEYLQLQTLDDNLFITTRCAINIIIAFQRQRTCRLFHFLKQDMF